MATASVRFLSRNDHKKQKELEEARKAGLAPAEVDEDGNEINPHIPKFMSDTPFYLNLGKSEKPSLDHQRLNKKSDHAKDAETKWRCYDRGAKVHQASSFRKGSCKNCGALTHDHKSCPERPRKVGAKFTNKNIAADEKIESFESDYDGKRDRWNGCDTSKHSRVMRERYDAIEEARTKYLKEEKIKKLEGSDGADQEEEEDGDDELRVDEAKVDESKQKGFGKVEKRVRTTGGGSTGSVRNLRIREDTAKYLLNLDLDSAHYDPKTRSMRQDPLPNADPNEKFYSGDNHYRNSGQAQEFKQLNVHAWEAFDKGQDMHTQAAPSQAALLYEGFRAAKEKLKSQQKEAMTAKYGNASTKDEIPMELLLGQSERQVEYDRAGRVIKGQEVIVLPKSKYEEEVYVNNHTSVYGSWWKDSQWGYKCCQQTIRNSYCTGSAGIEAAEAVLDLMKANVARKEVASEERAKKKGKEKRMVSWGSDVPEDMELNEEALRNALKKEDERKREEKDERKRKYNVKDSNEVTPEEMEAHRMKRVHHEDPMKNFL
ncbi:unnamed protein product [Microthlaspi erraticum]|uniref:Pre-mRNA-splicing factor SLU7 n=1 Tax=Microthlaspi erraticum TaxID=1685480 RepID=A0A6D2ISL1_9BRAS|nr:unnamed protein product [Microthlaspi erraticum]